MTKTPANIRHQYENTKEKINKSNTQKWRRRTEKAENQRTKPDIFFLHQNCCKERAIIAKISAAQVEYSNFFYQFYNFSISIKSQISMSDASASEGQLPRAVLRWRKPWASTLITQPFKNLSWKYKRGQSGSSSILHTFLSSFQSSKLNFWRETPTWFENLLESLAKSIEKIFIPPLIEIERWGARKRWIFGITISTMHCRYR